MLTLLILLFPQTAFGHGAIAYSANPDQTFRVYADWNRSSQTLAEDGATAGCAAHGGVNCQIVKTSNSLCHAIAVVNEGGAGWGLGQATNQRAAQAQAIAKCLQLEPYGSCVVRKSYCDTFPSNFLPDDAAINPATGSPEEIQPEGEPCRSPPNFYGCAEDIGPYGTAQDRKDRRIYCKMAFC